MKSNEEKSIMEYPISRKVKFMNKWAVMECPVCKKRSCYYVGEDCPAGVDKFENAGFSPDDMVCYKCDKTKTEVPYDEWNAEDITEIFGSELEDQNRHGLVEMPRMLYDTLKKTVPEEFHTEVVRTFAEKMLSDWR